MEHELYRTASREYDVTFYFVYDWRRDASWNFTDYRIPVTTFWYILEGSRTLMASGKEYILEPGMLVALPTHVTVSTAHAKRDESPIRYLSLGIQAITGGLDWTERYGIPIVMPVSQGQELRELIRLWRELRDDVARFRQFLDESSECFVAAIRTSFTLAWEGKLKQWLSLMTQVTLPYMSTPNPITDQRVNEICAYIRRNYADPLHSGAIAKHVALSEGHMRAVFRQIMGMSPHQYMLQIRIGKAKELLASGQLSLAEIAGMTGFDDLSYFIQMFRKREGLTPASYRKRAGAWEE
jgi:AraC-like DNA-binding protein